jgi:hypothetical protein
MNSQKYPFYNRLKSHGALGVSIGLILVFFVPILITGRTLSTTHILYNFFPWSAVYPQRSHPNYNLFGDVVDYYYPAIIFLKHWLWEGILPLWNQTIAGGQPFHLGIYFFIFPLNLLYLFFPIELAFTLHALLRLLVANIFTYLLSRELKLSPISSLLAAIVYAFNGFNLAWLTWPHTSETALLPLILWLILKALHQGQDRYLLLLVFAIMMLLAGGFLPIAGYVLYAGAGFALVILGSQYRSGEYSFRTFITRSLVIFLVIGAGISISAFHLIPFWDNLLRSGYAVERLQQPDLYRDFHLPWWQLILYLIPNYYGGINTPYWGSVNIVETMGYIGVLPLVLSIVSLGRLGAYQLLTPGYIYSLSVTFFSLSVVYGLKPISDFITLLPGFRLSINTRLICLASFGMAFLAAYGLEFIQHLKINGKNIKTAAWVIGIGGLLVGFLGVIEYYWLRVIHSPTGFNEGFAGVFGSPSAIKATIYSSLRQGNLDVLKGIVMFGGQLLAGIILFSICLWVKIPNGWTQTFLIAIVAIDLISFAYFFLPTAPLTEAYPTIPSLKTIQSPPSRFLAVAGRVFWGNTGTAYQLENAAGHTFNQPERYTRYLSRIDANAWDRRTHGTQLMLGKHVRDLDSRLIDLLSVRYVFDAPTSETNLTNRLIADQAGSQVPVGEIHGSTQQGQTFIATADNLHQIDLLMATYARTNQKEVIFHLKTNPSAANDLACLTIPADKILNNQWVSFRFKPVVDSANRRFYFYLESPSSQPGNAITVWSNPTDTYAGGQHHVNGLPVNGDLAFRTFAKAQLPAKFKILRLGPDMVIIENKAAMPRAYAVPFSLVLKDEGKILQKLQSSNHDPRQTIIIEEAAPPFLHLEKNFDFDPDRVKIVRYEPNRVDLHVTLPTPGWVVLTDLNYPGWAVEVDGQKERLFQTNYLVRAVPVKTGRHTITFRYWPTGFTIGLTTSAITLIGIIIVFAFRRRRLSIP